MPKKSKVTKATKKTLKPTKPTTVDKPAKTSPCVFPGRRW